MRGQDANGAVLAPYAVAWVAITEGCNAKEEAVRVYDELKMKLAGLK